MDGIVRFPTELPDIHTAPPRIANEALSLKNDQYRKLYRMCAGLDALLHFGHVQERFSKTKLTVPLPFTIELILIIEEFFSNNAFYSQRKDAALDFMKDWPCWKNWTEQTSKDTCINGLPYFSWNEADKQRILSEFINLQRYKSESKPVPMAAIITFASAVNDLRCFFIVLNALKKSNVERHKQLARNVQNALQRLCGWSVP